MKVKELVNYCYDTIIIYRCLDLDNGAFKDLFKGIKEEIPHGLLELQVRNFGAKKVGVVEIEVV